MSHAVLEQPRGSASSASTLTAAKPNNGLRLVRGAPHSKGDLDGLRPAVSMREWGLEDLQ